MSKDSIMGATGKVIRVIICGYYGQGNVGDEALLVSILSQLRELFSPQTVRRNPEEEIPPVSDHNRFYQTIVVSANPKKTQKDYPVDRAYSRWGIIRQVLSLGKDDVFIWGGGSLIQDVTGWKSPLYYLTLMKLAQLKGAKTIALAQGIGPIRNPIIKWLTRLVLANCNGISVRDNDSARILEKWKLKFITAADPVWALDSIIPSGELELQLPPPPRIAVNLRQHPLLTPQKLETLIQTLLQLQQVTKCNILLLPFQPSQDLSVCQRVAERIPNCQILHLENPRKLKGLFSRLDMLIGMRLHSLIMAASEGCKCFALSYDPKVTSLMKEVGIEGYRLENLPNDKQTILEKILQLYQTEDRQLWQQKARSLAQSAQKHKQLLLEVIPLPTTKETSIKTVSVLGLPLHVSDDYEEWLLKRLERGVSTHVVTMNAEMVMMARKNPQLAEAIKAADLVVPDGSGVVLYLRKKGIRQKRVAGIELAASLIQKIGAKGEDYPVCFYGAAPGVAEKAAQFWLQKVPSLNFICNHGYLSPSQMEVWCEQIRAVQPKLILVALGVPKQEIWIANHRHLVENAIWIGVGGSFDIWAGVKKRAPRFFQENHLEWLYRLYQEPHRWRRMLALPHFFWVALLRDN